MQLLGGTHDSVEFLQEPPVYLGQFVYLIDGISGTERFGDNEDTGVGRFMECLVDVGYHQLLVFHETMHALSDHTQPFLDRLFEGAPDRHHLAHRFHARPQLTSHTMKLTQIPARDLADHIVESRFEESTCRLRHRVFQIKKAVTQSQLGCDESQRITGCFRGQRRRTGETGVHFDHAVVFALRIESILHITFAHDTDMTDDPDSQFTKFMILAVGQCL